MDRLKSKTILIGRESGQGRLLVALLGSGKGAAIGGVGSVPASVSRCRPNERTAHCRIDVDLSGNMVLTNIKPENVTFVNDLQIQSKKIDSSCTISLGKDKYPLDLDLILHTAIKLVEATTPSSSAKTYSIQHLEEVWNRYKTSMNKIRRREKEQRKKVMFIQKMIWVVSSMIMLLLMNIIREKIQNFVLKCFLMGLLSIVVAVIVCKIFHKEYTKEDTSFEDDKDNAEAELYAHYVCPNPQCNHFMGNHPYKVLRQNKKCPYCGCSLTDK